MASQLPPVVLTMGEPAGIGAEIALRAWLALRCTDILLDLGASRTGRRPVLVGFALETTNVEAYARDKLVRKKADLIVANEASVGFGGDDNEALLVSQTGTEPTGRLSKRDLADVILDRVRALISS